MKKILAFFKGYKTYIVVVAGLVYRQLSAGNVRRIALEAVQPGDDVAGFDLIPLLE